MASTWGHEIGSINRPRGVSRVPFNNSENPMKITHIHTQIVRLPVDEPLAGGPVVAGATRDFVVLRAGTDAGVEGIGVTFFGGALTGALRAAVDGLGALAIGEDPL